MRGNWILVLKVVSYIYWLVTLNLVVSLNLLVTFNLLATLNLVVTLRVESGYIGLEIFGPPHLTKKIFGR